MPTTTRPAADGRAGRPVLVVLREGGLAEFLTAIPAYRALAWAYARYRRVLVCGPALAPLVPYTGAFDAAVAAEPDEPLAGRVEQPRVAVNLGGHDPRAHRRLLALAPGRLIAFAHPAVGETRHGATWRPGEADPVRCRRLLAAHGVRVDPTDAALIPPARPVPREVRGATLLYPGATGGDVRARVARCVAVVHTERAAGHAVVVVGGANGVSIAVAVAEGAGLPPDRVFAGRLSTLDLAALVAAARGVITDDPGVGLLALALRTPWLDALRVEPAADAVVLPVEAPAAVAH